MTIDRDTQTVAPTAESLPQDLSIEDSLEDASRRKLLTRVARAGATAVPVSLVLLDSAKANTSGSPGTSF
jgi:hypothetical protein